MKRRVIEWSIVAVLASAGCTETTILSPDIEPGCESPLACQVAGPDLVLEPLTLLLSPGHAKDAVTGRDLLEAGETYNVVVKVWNRGDAVAAADTLNLWPGTVPIPALSPGEIFMDTVQLVAPTRIGRFDADTTYLYASLNPRRAEDPFNANDRSRSATFIVKLPVVRVTLAFPDSVRENTPFTATISIHNSSRYAAMPARALTFCMFDFDVGCGSWAGAPFHLEEVPAIQPGATWTKAMTVIVPPIDDRHYADWDWELMACVDEPGTTLTQFLSTHSRICLLDGSRLRVRPEIAGAR